MSRIEELPFMTAFAPSRTPYEEHDPSTTLTVQAKVYAAVTRLQASVDQADGLEAIREVAANLMGCEEVAVYKIDQDKAALWLYWSFGIDPNKYSCFDVLSEPALERVLAGQIVYPSNSGSDQLLSEEISASALIPIIRSGETSAVLILFRLLPQRSGLEAADKQICEVLSHHAGRAIGPVQD